MPKRRSKRRSEVLEDSDEEMEDASPGEEELDEESVAALAMTFSSQAPVATQEIISVKTSEQRNLMNMSEEKREKAVVDLSRLVLFKAFAGESIDRAKCVKEAGINDARISSAAFKEVDERLRNCFGFELTRIPEWMNKWKAITKLMKDRYYVINKLHDESGEHARALHAVHDPVQKGFLMVVLALCYCKGVPRADGSRWISDQELYALLNRLDDSLPREPPTMGSKHARLTAQSQGNQNGPNPDALLQSFCSHDYLLREKGEMGENDECMMYCIGPRSIMEVGNEQVLTFCAEILDEEVDQVMLTELQAIETVVEN